MTAEHVPHQKYWLTAAGCEATGGHVPDLDQHHCKVCGVRLEVTC